MSSAVNPAGCDARADAAPRLPVILLSGFLGSGKTTLLSRLLRHERLRDTAVVINEFGEIALDHLLVAAVDAQTVLLDGGCVCCAVRDDLAETLHALHARRAEGGVPAFGRVVIETSGLADPTAIAALLLRDAALARRFALDAVIVTVDAVHAQGQLDTQPEAVRQVLLADRLLLTKTDLVGEDDYWKLVARLHALNPAAARLNCVRGEIDPDELIGAGARASAETPAQVARWHAPSAAAHAACGHDHAHGGAADCAPAPHEAGADAAHGRGVRAHCLRIDEPFDWDVLSSWLGSVAFHHGDRLLRLKAIVNVRGEDAPVVMHGVQRWLHEAESLPAWPDAERSSRFVFIVRDLPRAALTDALAAARRDGRNDAGAAMCIADPGDLAKNGRIAIAGSAPA
ncbi:MAG: GTP-binding protein [Rudaea sp.]|uniref:CobW family GTP-binding protein n=1 Tax=Rudaea sp. TaxID=2136325 RepID=UPI0039E61E3F